MTKLFSIVTFGFFLSFIAVAGIDEDQPFFFGVGNSAFQVEGTPQNSDWLQFTRTPGAIKDGTNADVATDFWNRYREDFALAKQLGATSFRISIAWDRLEPIRGQWDEEALTKYEQIITAMREFELEPIVTLHHFANPSWIADEGGLLAPSFPSDFTAYAEKVIARLSRGPAGVKYWMTFNEPEMLVFCGYLWGCWPPNIAQDPEKAQSAYANLARAHLSAVRAIRLGDYPDVLIGIAKHWTPIQPKTASLEDKIAAELYDGIFHRQFMTAVMEGKLHFAMPGATPMNETIELPDGRPGLDYLGINYYQRSLVSHQASYPFYSSETGPGVKNDMGWEVYPEGLLQSLREAAQYQIPILISENGVADRSDRLRGPFIEDHVAALITALKEGIRIIGYLYWSLTDNFEWDSGLDPRFGLVEMDYETLRRIPRASFYTFQRLIHFLRSRNVTNCDALISGRVKLSDP